MPALLPGLGSSTPWLFEPQVNVPGPTDAYGAAVWGTSGLCFYARMDELAGTTLNAIYGPNGTYNASGVTYGATGLTQNTSSALAASFLRPSGTTGGFASVAQLDAEAAMDGTAQFTHECWVTPLSDTARSSNQNLMDRTFYGLYLTPDNKPSAFYGVTGSNTTSSATALLAGTPYHLVYTFDGTTHTVYVNNVSVASAVDVRTAGGSLGIANYPGGADTANVTMDEIAVYQTAISAADILNHYTLGAPALAATTNHFFSLSGVGS